MLDRKFYALEGDLAHNDPGDYLQSILGKLDVQFVHQYIALLTCIDTWSQWHNNGIALLDYRHWTYSDTVFVQYVEALADSNAPIIRMSDLPFDYEMSGISRRLQLDRLISRTKLASKVLRDKGNPTFVSPSITATSEDIEELYKMYYAECGDEFDVYSVACNVSGTDRELAVLAGLINQVLVSHRQVWVMDWRTPSYDETVASALMGKNISLPTTKVAAARMKNVFNTINTLVPQAVWFISGAGKDYYNPAEKPDKFVYEWPYAQMDNWSGQNFTGLVSWSGIPKFLVIQALVEILKDVQKSPATLVTG